MLFAVCETLLVVVCRWALRVARGLLFVVVEVCCCLSVCRCLLFVVVVVCYCVLLMDVVWWLVLLLFDGSLLLVAVC